MLTRFFNDSERSLIASYLSEWRDRKGLRKEMNEEGDVISPKGELVSEIVSDLLKTFPERDIEKYPMGQSVWKQKDRDLLHERVRQLLYNIDRKTNIRDEGKIASRPSRYVSAHVLFKKKYANAILERRNLVKQENPTMEGMKTYNLAVEQLIAETKTTNPEVFEELEDLAAQMKSDLRASPDEQPEELRRTILELLPEDIISSVKAWEKRSGARIYVLAAWKDNEEGGPKLFNYASTNCGKYVKSDLAEEYRRKWLKWLSKSIGADFTMKVQDLKPCIYPDPRGYPTFPRLDRYSLTIEEEKILLRRYFTLTSIAAGGSQPSYVRISQLMEQHPGLVVETTRVPPQSPMIRDLKYWKRADVDAWIRYLIDGQTGCLPPERRFFWRMPCRSRGETELVVEEYNATPVVGSRLRWTPAEWLYGEEMQLVTSTLDFAQLSFEKLPLARTTHVYSPYNMRIFTLLRVMHGGDILLWSVITLGAQAERFGSIHPEIDLCTLSNAINPHIVLVHRILTGDVTSKPDWLPEAFFNTTHQEHKQWAVSTFCDSVRDSLTIVNQATETVVCGPLGVRMVIFSISRIVSNLQAARKLHEAQETGVCLPGGITPNLDVEGALLDVGNLLTWLKGKLLRTIDILQQSYELRSQQWEEQVMALEHLANSPEQPGEHDSGARATSDIPRSVDTLRSMIAQLKAQKAEREDNQDELDNSIIAAERTFKMNEEEDDEQPSIPEATNHLAQLTLLEKSLINTNEATEAHPRLESMPVSPLPSQSNQESQDIHTITKPVEELELNPINTFEDETDRYIQSSKAEVALGSMAENTVEEMEKMSDATHARGKGRTCGRSGRRARRAGGWAQGVGNRGAALESMPEETSSTRQLRPRK